MILDVSGLHFDFTDMFLVMCFWFFWFFWFLDSEATNNSWEFVHRITCMHASGLGLLAIRRIGNISNFLFVFLFHFQRLRVWYSFVIPFLSPVFWEGFWFKFVFDIFNPTLHYGIRDGKVTWLIYLTKAVRRSWVGFNVIIENSLVVK